MLCFIGIRRLKTWLRQLFFKKCHFVQSKPTEQKLLVSKMTSSEWFLRCRVEFLVEKGNSWNAADTLVFFLLSVQNWMKNGVFQWQSKGCEKFFNQLYLLLCHQSVTAVFCCSFFNRPTFIQLFVCQENQWRGQGSTKWNNPQGEELSFFCLFSNIMVHWGNQITNVN